LSIFDGDGDIIGIIIVGGNEHQN